MKENDIAHHKTICNPIDEGHVENQNSKVKDDSGQQTQFLHLLLHPSWLAHKHKLLKKEKGKKVEKPSLPLKFLHIWQARNILLQQDRKGQPVCGL